MEEFNLTTDNNGKYSYTWTPTTVGTYTVKVIYDGSKIQIENEIKYQKEYCKLFLK